MNDGNIKSEKLDVYSLTGIYENTPFVMDSLAERFRYHRSSLSDLVFKPYSIYYDDMNFKPNYNGYIKINAIDEKHIEVAHIKDENIVQQIMLKGKIENDVFKVSRKKIYGVPGLYGYFLTNYIYFRNKDGNIKVSYGISWQGWMLVFFLGDKVNDGSRSEFKRIIE